MELKDLVGLHELSGVDMNSESIEERYGLSFDDCQVINFVLDGKVYTAIEDPSDGYRSAMRDILESDRTVANRFAPVQVLGVMRLFSRYGNDDVIDFYDTKNGKLVLSVGTTNSDDYYPCWEAAFTPENMSLNDDQERPQ